MSTRKKPNSGNPAKRAHRCPDCNAPISREDYIVAEYNGVDHEPGCPLKGQIDLIEQAERADLNSRRNREQNGIVGERALQPPEVVELRIMHADAVPDEWSIVSILFPDGEYTRAYARRVFTDFLWGAK